MLRVGFGILAAGLLTAACAATGGQADSGADGPKSVAQDENRLVCIEEHAVGSNRKEKVCMTRKQMQARTAQSRDALRRQRSRGADSSQQGGVQ